MKISPSPTNPSISHVNVATGIPYDRLIPAFEASLGKWDPVAGAPLWEKKASWPEVETAIAKMAEPFGLMVMVKIDQGRITSLSGKAKRCTLYIVGNPVIANQIIDIDLRGSFPDAIRTNSRKRRCGVEARPPTGRRAAKPLCLRSRDRGFHPVICRSRPARAGLAPPGTKTGDRTR